MSEPHAQADDRHQPNDSGVTTLLHQAARTYASHGVAIFPCRPRDKRPLTARGFHDATTDLDQIDAWWTETPQANIGVPLGANNVFALDVDGPAGRAVLNEFEDTYAPLPDTYQVVTGREEGEGRHYLFFQPNGDPVRNRQIGDHLETRGDGGYVIAAPSIHPSGAHYQAVGVWSQIVDAPGWLLALATKPATEPLQAPIGTAYAGGPDQVAEKRLRGLAGNLAIMPPDSGRNNTLNHAAYTAGQLVGAGRLDRTHAEEVLTTAAVRAGLTPSETAATIASGLDAGARDPDHAQPTSGPLPPVTTLPGAPTDDQSDEPTSAFDQLVQQEVLRILAREQAREIVARQQLGDQPVPPLVRLDSFLAQPDPDVTYRIEGLWPSDGRCLLAAQYKAGKTTTVGNILRCLVDGEPLFGAFPVTIPAGRIVLLDDELHENTLRRWLRDQDIRNTGRIHVVPLRGKLSTFNLLDASIREEWAAQIRAVDAEVVILDCLRPIIDALGLSEDKDTGKVLTAFDELLETAQVSEGLIVHHMGHTGERSRGDSRLRDWPDAEWKLVREQTEDGEDDPTAPRYFSAVGRDVEVTEQRLTLKDGRRLEIIGGSRKAMKQWELMATVIQVVIDQPGIAQRDVPAAVREAGGKGRREKILDVLKLAAREGYIELGDGGAHPRVPAVPQYHGNAGTPPVTVVDNPAVPAVPHPGEHPVPRPLKGEPGNARGSDLWGTPPDANEVPL